jgi:Xaa-Pro aminopeptidase
MGTMCCLASDKTTGSIYKAISARTRIIDGMNSTTALKAIKNPVEINGLRSVMVRDGVAWVKTLCWIQDAILRGDTLSEISVARKIASARAEQDGYKGESFHPISSFGYHGAVVHYSVTEESSIAFEPAGIFLLDCGGQFLDGTTDTTRTIALGESTQEQKTDFTLALKGTLGISMLRFPKGTKGYQIDILARMALWQEGKNYGHGTGHGVGFFLNVHEGPQTIGTSASGYLNVILEPGMITTVEPAIYKDGEYGMRTENMTLVVPDRETAYGTFYRFETLTLVPIDRSLVDTSLLTPAEIRWIDDYHDRIWKTLSDRLGPSERKWLRKATIPLIS